jgi:hypothetical protein
MRCQSEPFFSPRHVSTSTRESSKTPNRYEIFLDFLRFGWGKGICARYLLFHAHPPLPPPPFPPPFLPESSGRRHLGIETSTNNLNLLKRAFKNNYIVHPNTKRIFFLA